MWLGALTFTTLIAVVPWWLNFAMGPRWVLLSAALPIAVVVAQPKLEPNWWPLWTLAWAIGSIAWAPHPMNAAWGAWQLVLLCAAFAVGTTLRNPNGLAWGLCAGVAVNSGVMLAELSGLQLVPTVAPPSGLLANRGVLGGIAAVALVLAWAQLRSWPLALLCAPSILFTSSRAAWIGLASTATLWAVRRYGAWASAGACWVAMLIGYVLLKGPAFWYDLAIGHRLAVWLDLLPGFTLLGVGAGQFESEFPLLNQRLDTSLGRMEFAHNDTIQFVYELGLGAIPLVGTLWWAAFRPHPAGYALLCLMVVALFDFPLHLPHGILVAGVLAGGLCGAWARGRDYPRDCGGLTP